MIEWSGQRRSPATQARTNGVQENRPREGTGHEGVFINMPTRATLMEDLQRRFRAGQGFSVATINLDHVVKLRQPGPFRTAYTKHTHVVADGNPIVWLSRIAGHRIDLVPGSDLTAPVAALAAAEGVPVALLGATQETLKAAAQVLEARAPGLKVVAQIAPPYGFVPDGPQADACLEELAASGAGLCFLALGAPKQEIFAAHAQARLPDVGFLSIGAGLDFLSGAQARAPGVVRALALEWIWRLGTNPRRLAWRYGACIAILPGLMLRAVRSRGQTPPEQTSPPRSEAS
jgi:N-acetylglucosaminyldiphosphoundecaprenol N-acetyl-beta-D-mannosaminyltransferase